MHEGEKIKQTIEQNNGNFCFLKNLWIMTEYTENKKYVYQLVE